MTTHEEAQLKIYRMTNNKTKNESLCIQIQIVIRNENSFNISHQSVTVFKR